VCQVRNIAVLAKEQKETERNRKERKGKERKETERKGKEGNRRERSGKNRQMNRFMDITGRTREQP